MYRVLPGSGPAVEHPVRGQPALPSRRGLALGCAARPVTTSQPLTSGEPGRPLEESGPGSRSVMGRRVRRGVVWRSWHGEWRTAPDSRPFGCTLLTAVGSPWLCWADAAHRIKIQTLESRRSAIRAAWVICCAHRVVLHPAHPYGLGDARTQGLIGLAAAGWQPLAVPGDAFSRWCLPMMPPGRSRPRWPARRASTAWGGQRPVTYEELNRIAGWAVGRGRLRLLWPSTGRANCDLLTRSCRFEAGQLAALTGWVPAVGPGAASGLAETASDVMAGPSSRRADVLARRAHRLRAAQRRRNSPGTTVPPGMPDGNGQTDGSMPPVTARSSWRSLGDRGGSRR